MQSPLTAATIKDRLAHRPADVVGQRDGSLPDAVLVAEDRQIDPRAHWLCAHRAKPVDHENMPSMSISTEASAKIRPNLTGLIDRTVIETVLEDEGGVPSSPDVSAMASPGKESKPR
jgi:hypothetical protein